MIKKHPQSLEKMRILIFGSKGFIGKSAVKAFQKAGADVTAVSRTEYDATDISEKNLRKLAEFIKNKDVIVNLMAVVNSHEKTATIESEIVNTQFPRFLMEAVREHAPKAKIIFSSSQTVYGKAKKTLIDESHPVEPDTLYAKQKRVAEKIYEEYAREYGIAVTILRMSNVYGPDAPTSRSVISLFLERAKADKDITVFGEGDELRDYLYIDDTANALVVAAISPLAHHIYNVGSGEASCLTEIAKKAVANTGKGRIIYVPFPENYARYPGHIILDGTLFRKETGWEPKVGLNEALKRMLK